MLEEEQNNYNETDNNNDNQNYRDKKLYCHANIRLIILSFLSIGVVTGSFIGLFSNILSSCETLGIVTNIVMLFAPSPLSYLK